MEQDYSESSFFSVSGAHQAEAVQQLRLDSGSRKHLFYKVFRDGEYFFLKSLRPEYMQQTFCHEVLQKEYALGSSLNCDYIVRYRELIDTPNECSVLMDYVNGMTLDEFVSKHPGYFSQANNLRKFLSQLCQALHELHSHQALHLDLKPSNIMLTNVNHDVRLIDLGCSYMDARPDLMGQTAAYAAPEQKDGSYDVDARTDIYSLGKILEGLSPQQPFYRKIMARCLKERKEERFQSVEELLTLLDEHNAGGGRKWFLLVLLFVIVAFISWQYIWKPDASLIVDGTEFKDTTCLDTFYFRVLSVADHSAAVIPVPEDGSPYEKDIVIPESVTFSGETFYIREIAANAFRECSLITNIHIPPTITTIHNSALRNCCRITGLYLPPSLRNLYYEPFASCRSLTNVSWPASAIRVPRNCFVACVSLRAISLPEGVVSIGQDAFAGCDSLEDVQLPNTIQRIDRGVFYQCRSLRTITLPDHVKVLGEYLFYKCESLEEIKMLAKEPPKISTIVDNSFHGVIRVPKASLSKYQRAKGWSELNLQPIEEE